MANTKSAERCPPSLKRRAEPCHNFQVRPPSSSWRRPSKPAMGAGAGVLAEPVSTSTHAQKKVITASRRAPKARRPRRCRGRKGLSRA